MLDEIRPIRKLCRDKGLKLHLDGARIFNALVASGEEAEHWGEQFDTLSICLSKGLGCPIGSVLVGSKDAIKRARKIRKAMGGGMRQAGLLAAAGIYALDFNVRRLKEDHSRATVIGEEMGKHPLVEKILPVQTNIVIAKLRGIKPEEMLAKLGESDIKAVKFGKDQIRLVTHLDFTDSMLEAFVQRIHRIN